MVKIIELPQKEISSKTNKKFEVKFEKENMNTNNLLFDKKKYHK